MHFDGKVSFDWFSLDRNWEKDKLVMGKQVYNLGDYADPVWVGLTRFKKCFWFLFFTEH